MGKEKPVKKPNSVKEKKKLEQKERPESNLLEDNNFELLDNFKNNYMKYILGSVLFILLIYFQYTYSKSSRYDSKRDSDVDYWDILGVETNSNLPIINKKYRELAKIW